MNNVYEVKNLVREVLTESEINLINKINFVEDDDKRLIKLRSVFFGQTDRTDIYIRVKDYVDTAWLVYKIYTLGKRYEF
jgi:hypothetical protein